MSRKAVLITVAFLLLGAGYLWLYQSRRVPPLSVSFMQMRGASPVFSFNDSVVLEEVKVVETAAEGASAESGEGAGGDDARVLWHLQLRPDDEARSDDDRHRTRAVSYGRGVRGLRPVEGTERRGQPLRIGGRYRFEAVTRDDGAVSLDFEVSDPR